MDKQSKNSDRSNKNNTTTSNNIGIDSINNNINRQKEILRAQQKQQRDNIKNLKKQQEHETMFDFILQWGSLACSKLLFFPIEFPIHALTTFIQSQPTPQQPLSPSSLQNSVSPYIQLPLSSTLSLPPIHSFTYNITTSSFVENLPTPVSTSLINLLRQKGVHIYDGGMVYIVHNMITILINFIQRSFNNFQTNLKHNHKHGKSRLSKNTIQLVSGSLSLLKYALTLPLDVIMTRLIVHKFYRSNNTRNNLNDCTFSGVCKNEGIRALYTGWEVVVLKSLLEIVYSKLDNILKSKNNQYPHNQQYQNSQQQSEKSPLQIALLGAKILLDYILTVVKVRLNIRNIGLFKTIKNIISRKGIKGLFSGLNTYFLLFPLWMISILVANIIFLKVKGALDKSIIPIPPNPSQSPKSSNISSSPSTYDGDDSADSGLYLIGDISSQLVKDDSDNNDGNIIENNNIDSNQHTSEEEEEEEEERETQVCDGLKDIQEKEEIQQEKEQKQEEIQEKLLEDGVEEEKNK
ncbi:hypothetical protein RB653_005046 [Dictyostelium firmibasis]|uniref:Uncharacterized protein n=1 Tax=Dictyostelium firmibasis TaxID=79012 RepID=A0AAN7U8Q2_9MYCE